MSEMKFNVPTIIGKLLDNTFNPFTHMDKRDDLAEFCGYADELRIRVLIKQKDLLFVTAQKVLSFFGYELYIVKAKNCYKFDSVATGINLIKSELEKRKITRSKFARKLDITEVALYNYFKQPNIKVGTLVKLFNALDYEVVTKSNNNEKAYIVGFNDGYDEKYEQIYDSCLGEVELTSTHQDFLSEFLEKCVELDFNGKVRSSVLYKAYSDFWDYNKADRPKTQQSHLKNKTRNSFGQLGKREFTELCCRKFVLDGEYYVGLKLKEKGI